MHKPTMPKHGQDCLYSPIYTSKKVTKLSYQCRFVENCFLYKTVIVEIRNNLIPTIKAHLLKHTRQKFELADNLNNMLSAAVANKDLYYGK